MQKRIREFIIRNIESELVLSCKTELKQITKDLNNIYQNYIENGGCMLYAYDVKKKEIVGTISLKKDKDLYILKRFYVDKKYRNQKIGLMLYNELEKTIIKKNIKKLYLTSGAELKNAHNFYLKNGWIIEDSNPGIEIRKNALVFKKEMLNNLEYNYI